MTGMDLEFAELSEQATVMEQQLGKLLARLEQTHGQPFPAEEEGSRPEPAEEERLGSASKRRLEELLEEAKKDRSKAFELKQELDRLGVFKEYEDRFLDLFKKAA
jgi:hypothetical protein